MSKLTEEEYLTVGNLQKVRMARYILRDMLPDSVIARDEWEKMLEKMYEWEDRLFKKVDELQGEN